MKPWIIWAAILIHLIWGVGGLIDPTGTIVSVAYRPPAIYPFSHSVFVWIYLGVAAAATFGMIAERKHIGWVLPQQFVLMGSLFSGLSIVASGISITGVETSRWALLANQAPNGSLVIFHTLALLELYGGFEWIRSRFRSLP